MALRPYNILGAPEDATDVLGTLQGYTTTTTAAGTTTLTDASTALQVFTGSTTQTVVLPVTSTIVVGVQYTIANKSTGSVTVNASDGSLVATVAASSTAQVSCNSVAGTTNAAWTLLPAAASGGTPGGSSGQLQYKNSSTFGGASEVEVENGKLRLKDTTTFTAPVSGGVDLVSRSVAGRSIPGFMSSDGIVYDLQQNFTRSSQIVIKPVVGNNLFTSLGWLTMVATGTATAAAIATTNRYSYQSRVEAVQSTPSTTAVAGWRMNDRVVTLGGPSTGLGGFATTMLWGPGAFSTAASTCRAFCGMANSVAAPTDVDPSTLTDCVGIGWDAATDTNMQFLYNDASGTCTKVDLGSSFPRPTTDRTQLYRLSMYSPPGTSQIIYYTVTDILTGTAVSGNMNTNLPATTTLLCPRVWMSVGGTSSTIGVGLMSIVIDPLN